VELDGDRYVVDVTKQDMAKVHTEKELLLLEQANVQINQDILALHVP
jgi:hypothetical protein